MHLEKVDLEQRREFCRRSNALASIVILLFLFLGGRLWYLQVLRGDIFQKAADNNRIRAIRQRAERGLILDRKGDALVRNRARFGIFLDPYSLPIEDSEKTMRNLSEILKADLKEKIRESDFPGGQIELARDVNLEKVSGISERRSDLPGVFIEVTPERNYPYPRLVSHSVGYLRQISEEELAALKEEGYHLGDLIGQGGIEGFYDSFLRGRDGCKWVEVNARGKPLKVLDNYPSRPGNNIILSLDLNLQKIAAEALGEKAGAVVIMDPRNGEVLSLISNPGFDLETFTRPLSREKWEELSNDSQNRLSNRAIQGRYSPGSAFKVITALAGMEKGAIKPGERLYCGGTLRVGDRVYSCFRGKSHGYINMREALQHSCNIYFYQLGLRLGIGALASFSRQFDLGETTGIDLKGEDAGLVPDPWWKRIWRERIWYPGDTVNMSIGQGYLLVTPLQMASLMSVIANGGTLFKPRLVKSIVSPGGKTVLEFKPQKIRSLSLKPKNLRVLRESLRAVVSGGTGWRANLSFVEVAGKTGTAQNPRGEDHSWFIGYAPIDSPRLAIAVLVEHGGEGGETAAPIAGEILGRFLGADRMVHSEHQLPPAEIPGEG